MMRLVEFHNRKTRELVAVDVRRVLMVAEILDRDIIPNRSDGTTIIMEHGCQVAVMESYNRVLGLLLAEHAEEREGR